MRQPGNAGERASYRGRADQVAPGPVPPLQASWREWACRVLRPLEHWSPEQVLHAYLQILIAVLSIAAIYLLARPEPALARWGWIVGMTSQPFWIFATWRARQWGMFVLSLMYVYVWAAGIVNHF